MKTLGFSALIVGIFVLIHYYFIGELRSETYLNVLVVCVCIDLIVIFIACIEAGMSHKDELQKGCWFPPLCFLHLISAGILIFTPIGVTDENKLFTIQMTYSDGYTETLTYDLPKDSHFYIEGGSRYYNGSDRKYKHFPNRGGLIQRNIVRFKVISVKNK